MSQDHVCGFCITGHHDKCKRVVRWYEKEWSCHCECAT